ncbi:ABC transporter permease subunit [Salmonella enterica subsp. enterica]|nr:ABC transporter permease subunit [Salmonella enterica subsp. enterica]
MTIYTTVTGTTYAVDWARHLFSFAHEGAKMTLWISVLGLAGGAGYWTGGRFCPYVWPWFANHIATVFVKLFAARHRCRVMFIYFALRWRYNDLRIDPFSAAVVTIMINSGAYIAEITRGAVYPFTRFSRSRSGAGRSRRGNHPPCYFTLALRRILPPLGNQWDPLASKTPRCLLLSA